MENPSLIPIAGIIGSSLLLWLLWTSRRQFNGLKQIAAYVFIILSAIAILACIFLLIVISALSRLT